MGVYCNWNSGYLGDAKIRLVELSPEHVGLDYIWVLV